MWYTDQSVTLIVLISQDRLVNQLLNTGCDTTIFIWVITDITYDVVPWQRFIAEMLKINSF